MARRKTKVIRYYMLSEDTAYIQIGIIIQQLINRLCLQFPNIGKFVENGAARWFLPTIGRVALDAFACLGKERRKDSQLLVKFTIQGILKTSIVVHFYRVDSINEVTQGAIESIYYYTCRL